MESFIKEDKNGFDFTAVNTPLIVVNVNCLQIHALAYNKFNRFKHLVLSAKMRKWQLETKRLNLLKIVTKVVRSVGYMIFKLYGNCPYKDKFYETLENIRNLQPKFE